MKTAAPVVLSFLAALVLAFAGCNYAKPIMYIDIANHSGTSVENIEIKHPTGIFGMPELRNEQGHQHMTPLGAPCKFSIAFEDQSGKKYTGDYDLGYKCPREVAFEIGPGMSVTGKPVRP